MTPNGTGTNLRTDKGITTSTLDRVPTGAPSDVTNRSPFRALVTPPSAYSSYTLIATPSDPMGEPNHNFAIDITSKPSDPAETTGVRHIIGTVTNTNSTPASNVNIVVTMYDGSGAVVDEAVGYITGASTGLAAAGTPGATGSFNLPSEGSGHPYARVAAIAESSSAAAPASSPSTSPAAATSGSPSPSPSATGTSASPTPSPSTTDTATPSPSASQPSPSPTATPAAVPPCRSGGGAFAIATTPAYVQIVKGGRVRVNAALSQAHRACQAGLRLSVYVRGPGATLYHLSRTTTTAGAGRAFAEYAAVKADFRWYVVFSSVHSTTGLVQVR